MTFTEKHFSGLIRRTLLTGVFLSLLLLFAGFGLSVSGSAAGRPLLGAGVLALLLTPAARVAMLAYGYWRGGEYYFSLASLVVLAILCVSMLAG